MVRADHGRPRHKRISKMLELMALFIPISAFPFNVVITDETASGMDVHAPRKMNPSMVSKGTGSENKSNSLK